MLDLLWHARPGPPPAGNSIVVYSPGHLGDVLHAVPMLKALRAAKPAARLRWLVGPWSHELASRYLDFTDDILVFGPNLPAFTRDRLEWRQSALRQWQLVAGLRRGGVEWLVGPMDGVGRFLANALCPRVWAGIGDRRPPRVRAKVETVVQPYEKDRYEAEAWCGLLKRLGIDVQASRLIYAVTPAEQAEGASFLVAENVDGARPLALIAPGSGWSGKNWLPDRFAAVADWLRTAKGYQVAWVGSAAERNLLPADGGNDFDWMGKTSLPLLAAVMARSALFIGNDGGLLHFAAALDLPTVSVWGPTSPGKWGPKGARHRQLRRVERCAGCVYWDYREICRHNHICMTKIEVADVVAEIESLLAAAGPRPACREIS